MSVSVSVARLGSASVSGFVRFLGSAFGSGSCPRLSQKQLPQGGNIFRNKCGFCGLKLFAAAVTPQYADGGKPRCGCAFDVMAAVADHHGTGGVVDAQRGECMADYVGLGVARAVGRAAADKREVVREPEMPGNLLRERVGFEVATTSVAPCARRSRNNSGIPS